MLTASCRRRFGPAFTKQLEARRYVQQSVPRTPRSSPQTSTTKPSPRAQVKNRPFPVPANIKPSPSAQRKPIPTPRTVQRPGVTAHTPTLAEIKAFSIARQAIKARQMSDAEQLATYRTAIDMGETPWAMKTTLYDLIIPPKPTSLKAIRDNVANGVKNAQTMYLLASDYAFPGVTSTWRAHPQVFRAKSTSEKAWVAPFRREFLDIYQRIFTAIASGDRKELTKLTTYEFREKAMEYMERFQRTGHTFKWSLLGQRSPVKIVSLRGGPLYLAREDPKTGNRNIVQALVRFDTEQLLTCHDSSGRLMKPENGTYAAAEEGYTPMPRNVREYLVFENKMFYDDGWYVRDQLYEGVEPKFRSVEWGD